MEIDRRDFFGVIAAPLLRPLVPVVPMAQQHHGPLPVARWHHGYFDGFDTVPQSNAYIPGSVVIGRVMENSCNTVAWFDQNGNPIPGPCL